MEVPLLINPSIVFDGVVEPPLFRPSNDADLCTRRAGNAIRLRRYFIARMRDATCALAENARPVSVAAKSGDKGLRGETNRTC